MPTIGKMMRNPGSRRNFWLPPLLVAIAVVAGLIYQLAARRVPQPPRSAATVTSAGSLRLMSGFGPAFAGEMLAARVGLFEREGLQVELRVGGGAGDPINSVAGGSDMFGVTRADAFLLARARGAPIVAFAAGYIESPAVFYVLKRSGLRTPSDFVDRRIGRRSGDDTAIVYSALIAKLGLPRSRISEVSVEADLSMLLRGDVDVWPGHVGEEDYALSRQGVDHILIDPERYGVHLPGTVYFANEQTIAERPRLVQAFVKGVIAGWEFVYAKYASSVPIIAAFDEGRLTPDYIRFVLDRQREYLRPVDARFGEFNASQWRSLHNTLLAQRLFEEPVDLPKAVSYEFLRDAYRKPFSFGNEVR
jgi:ABC-type nitrate/sulfonate/bicarbonate transport system substrate-binding protein